MRFKNSRWMIVVGVVMAFLVLGTIVWASPPVSPPSAPLQATPGFDADLLDGHDSAFSGAATNAQRANKFLWASPNGRLSIKSMPLSQLNNRYVFKAVANTMQVASTEPVLKVENTRVATGGYAIAGINASDYVWRPAIYGENTGSSAGVYGRADGWHATVGYANSTSYAGVWGYNAGYGQGVYGQSAHGIGVWGKGANGMRGQSTSGSGVWGITDSGTGVYGTADNGDAVFGNSTSGVGGRFWSQNSVALRAKAGSANIIEAWAAGGERRFYVSNSGHVYADGAYHSYGADLAEMLPAADGLEPGDVLVVGRDGRLSRSTVSNSTDVAGVYSTQPGFLGSSGDESDLTGMVPLGIAGVVPVKASAENGPIQPGDLLTSSSIPGHAMKASSVMADGITFYLPGTILGKALEPLEEGTGVILVLVTLQ